MFIIPEKASAPYTAEAGPYTISILSAYFIDNELPSDMCVPLGGFILCPFIRTRNLSFP